MITCYFTDIQNKDNRMQRRHEPGTNVSALFLGGSLKRPCPGLYISYSAQVPTAECDVTRAAVLLID